MMPTRTTEPATPCAPSLAPNSSAAKATVWLKRVLQNPVVSCAAASSPSTWADRGVEALRRRPPRLRPPWGR